MKEALCKRLENAEQGRCYVVVKKHTVHPYMIGRCKDLRPHINKVYSLIQ